MQMLAAGGLPCLTDAIRGPDENNPEGYLEFEAVKAARYDWIQRLEGHAVKVVYPHLGKLPLDEWLRLIVVRRDSREIIASQDAMLRRLGEELSMPMEEAIEKLESDLREVDVWLESVSCWTVQSLEHREILQDPASAARRLAGFVAPLALDHRAMAAAVRPSLWRERNFTKDPS